jgi:predicted esterase
MNPEPRTPHPDPHADAPVLLAGAKLPGARAALILLHGRGATAEDILALADAFAQPDVAYLAPQAANIHDWPQWYPQRFIMPLAANEPYLSSALRLVDAIVAGVVRAGLPHERIVIGGFSQGACLALEYVARNARRWGGALGFSGGLIGPPGMARAYSGTLAGTPVFLGVSSGDAHIPTASVRESAAALAALGGAVTTRVYPGGWHSIIDDEIEAGRAILAGV